VCQKQHILCKQDPAPTPPRSAYLGDGLTLCSFSGSGDHSQHPCSCTDKHHRTIRGQRAFLCRPCWMKTDRPSASAYADSASQTRLEARSKPGRRLTCSLLLPCARAHHCCSACGPTSRPTGMTVGAHLHLSCNWHLQGLTVEGEKGGALTHTMATNAALVRRESSPRCAPPPSQARG